MDHNHQSNTQDEPKPTSGIFQSFFSFFLPSTNPDSLHKAHSSEMTQEEKEQFAYDVAHLSIEEMEQKSIEADKKCIDYLKQLHQCRSRRFDSCLDEYTSYISCYRRERGYLRTKEQFVAAKRKYLKDLQVQETHSEMIQEILSVQSEMRRELEQSSQKNHPVQ